MIKGIINKYKKIIMYAIFGVLTTFVNVVSYWLFAHVMLFESMLSTIIAWILAVMFAYLTNRKWVFKSDAKTQSAIGKEIISYFFCRLLTGIVDWICMFVFVDILEFNDMLIKLLANILVIILNYVASIFVIFKKNIVKNC